jgi:hypothetical protein
MLTAAPAAPGRSNAAVGAAALAAAALVDIPGLAAAPAAAVDVITHSYRESSTCINAIFLLILLLLL